MTPEDERALRIQHRFNNIVQAIAMKKGKDFAFSVAAAAYLMAIEAAVQDDFKELSDNRESTNKKDDQLRANLQQFHKYICQKMGADENEVLDMVPSFKEILRDIIRGTG